MSEPRLIFLFDVDGVIAETPHEECWKRAAVDWSIITPEFDFTGFYAEHVAGEPGEVGAQNILELLKEPGGKTYFEREQIAGAKAKREAAIKFRSPVKQGYVNQAIDRGEFRIFDDIGKLVLESKLDRIATAAVSSSENARGILKHIDLLDLARRVGVTYPVLDPGATFFELFDTTTLGAITYWHGARIEKINHYAMAYGMALESTPVNIGLESAPYPVVFEDAPKGIAAVHQLGFVSVGISRVSTSGMELASPESLLEAGAALAYTEKELAGLEYSDLKRAILDRIGAG